MRIRKIRVMVKSWKELWKKEKMVARSLDRGEKKTLAEQETVYFTSIEGLRQVLTDKQVARNFSCEMAL